MSLHQNDWAEQGRTELFLPYASPWLIHNGGLGRRSPVRGDPYCSTWTNIASQMMVLNPAAQPESHVAAPMILLYRRTFAEQAAFLPVSV